MRLLIAGMGGVLGSSLASVARAHGHLFIGVDRTHLDVRKPEVIEGIIGHYRPDAVINCAAYTNVERAENDIMACNLANAKLPELLAKKAVQYGARMIHFSSCGCFGNWADRPYSDNDSLRPTTVLHKSKAEGDELVRAAAPDALILRTGWLFGGTPYHEKNFVWRRLVEAQNASVLFADMFQKGNPTCAYDLAAQTCDLISRGFSGTYNCVAHGVATRLDYVRAIVECSGFSCRVEAAPLGYFRRLAPVSENESAVNSGLQALGLDHMPAWQDSVRKFVSEMMYYLNNGKSKT